MTWYQAAWYCNWLSEQEGIEVAHWCYQPDEENGYGPGMKAKANHLELSGYRLPTESEWEFACRAGAQTRRNYGETDTLLSQYAWSGLNGQNRTWPGAELKPNDFGLLDMLGNSAEWCDDAYDEDYPADSAEPVADRPETGEVLEVIRRAVRGGAFNGRPAYLRSADRFGYQPANHDSAFGFRVARTFQLERDQ